MITAYWHGPPDARLVVLVHGLAGSHRTWEHVVPALHDRFRVLSVDLPGARAIEAEAADLADLVARPAIVVGHSMGGLVATALAERAPASVHGLVLVDTPPTVESRLTARSGSERIVRLPVIGPLVWSALTDQRRRSGLRSAVAPGTPVPDVFVGDLRDTDHDAFVGSTTATENYVAERPLGQRLRDVKAPIEVVFGLADQRVEPASLSVYDGLAHVRVTTLPGIGHSPPWEAPGAVIDAVERLAAAPV